MRKYSLGAVELSQYETLTPAESLAWHNPDPHSYHSFHVERMGEDTYRWRDSRTAHFYIGTLVELTIAASSISCRRLNPEYNNQTQVLTLLSQAEIDDLFSDL